MLLPKRWQKSYTSFILRTTVQFIPNPNQTPSTTYSGIWLSAFRLFVMTHPNSRIDAMLRVIGSVDCTPAKCFWLVGSLANIAVLAGGWPKKDCLTVLLTACFFLGWFIFRSIQYSIGQRATLCHTRCSTDSPNESCGEPTAIHWNLRTSWW